ncbi:MAG: AraC family transcriptional regulator, glycine betaine-responsive activator [Gammaproteobacteria bacterium]|nr:AraC family transcriptional regulator, glycine betaine-responsive activator [Gammaproteobacteria bacterium]
MESPAVLRKCRYAFLTLPNYSLIAVANALEPLRMANRVVGREVYEWSIISMDGRAADASSGLTLSPTGALDKLGAVDILFVCGGINVREAVSPALLSALRRLADRRVPLGALCTGGYALARAGLLDNFRATIHWENLSALREEFPRVRISDQLFTIDRDRFTCSGGTAPLDLMLNLIQLKLGSRISQLVSEQFIVDRVRKGTDRQYIPLRAQIGVSHRGLIRVAQLMEENIEKPLSLDKIAKATGLSRRQIERLFRRDLNCVPKRYYLEMRLRRARELLLQTAMPIMDITAACGFQSPPHFSKCYRNQFGHPPSAERKIGAGGSLSDAPADAARAAEPRAALTF